MCESKPTSSRLRFPSHPVVSVVVISATMLAGCGEKSEDSSQPEGSKETVAADVYEVAGRVMRVPDTQDYLVIRHGNVPGFMEPMTMPFPLRNVEMISGLQKGDSVHFVIEVTDGSAEITAIEKVP